MRQFSSNVKVLLASELSTYFYMVAIEFASGTVRHTNLPYDLNISGLGLFYANSGLHGIDPPKVTNVVDRSAYKIIYADPDFSFRSQLLSGVTGTKITVRLGFINPFETTFGGAAPGEPLTQLEDTVIVYRGVLDTYGYVVKESTEVLVTLECSSPMADLGLIRTFNASPGAMKKLNAADTAYDGVHQGSSAVNILWGKAG